MSYNLLHIGFTDREKFIIVNDIPYQMCCGNSYADKVKNGICLDDVICYEFNELYHNNLDSNLLLKCNTDNKERDEKNISNYRTNYFQMHKKNKSNKYSKKQYKEHNKNFSPSLKKMLKNKMLKNKNITKLNRRNFKRINNNELELSVIDYSNPVNKINKDLNTYARWYNISLDIIDISNTFKQKDDISDWCYYGSYDIRTASDDDHYYEWYEDNFGDL
jgi:hypothetical protein